MTSFVVPARYKGPPHSGNGGWVSGRLATHLPGAHTVSVRLRTPPPLDRELVVEPSEDGGVRLTDGDVLVAVATPAAALDADLVAPVAHEVAVASGGAYEGFDDHPFPTCYSCGTGRDDGLGLRPGRVAGGGGEYAAAWTPGDGGVEDVWAALDCPGGWSAGIAGRPMVLGTMTAQVEELPVAGEPHVVMAWPRGGDGRKYLSGSALYAADGRLLARAEATWIAVDPTAVRPA